MAKVDLAKALEGIHGKVGNLLFKKQDGHQIVMTLPDFSDRPTPTQVEAQKPVMKRAGLPWETLKTENAPLAKAYAAKAKQLKRSVFSVGTTVEAVALDWLGNPNSRVQLVGGPLSRCA